ncbi:helix-turn-helix domain-containing protein [Listeria fleischmannii]|uniref:Putative HTH-type transcriptional regulator n=1 Tax=Listeria fleischmannii FSL S10-1203 TaxID=1265822 RepID=W7DG75_9LIST|nr:helix-turn-helix transcriptional regulator [Listeria fleischmannii]EUJ59187.1 putative HTH-type transcriptional regulator [Listeria fleischmannii FSL S10-1203]
MQFKDRISQLREINRLTQQNIADKLGVNVVTYSNYERGVRTPSFKTLTKLADIFGVTVDYLLVRDTQSKEEDSLTSIFNNQLTAKQKEEVMLFMKFLIYRDQDNVKLIK